MYSMYLQVLKLGQMLLNIRGKYSASIRVCRVGEGFRFFRDMMHGHVGLDNVDPDVSCFFGKGA